MLRVSLIFQRVITPFIRAQSNKALTYEQAVAKYKEEIERVKQNPKMKALLEEEFADFKRRQADPNYKPAETRPKLGWGEAFSKKEDEHFKHSAY
ncbi:MAG: hypothetical protein K0Q57_111 [Gammaproteobacteria bacterium]|jgi:hypothetical protein|nr:hypothetical protein [Gammaproteobacteria bacterium]